MFINFKCANYDLGKSYKIPESIFKKKSKQTNNPKTTYNGFFEIFISKSLLSDLNGIDNIVFIA